VTFGKQGRQVTEQALYEYLAFILYNVPRKLDSPLR